MSYGMHLTHSLYILDSTMCIEFQNSRLSSKLLGIDRPLHLHISLQYFLLPSYCTSNFQKAYRVSTVQDNICIVFVLGLLHDWYGYQVINVMV